MITKKSILFVCMGNICRSPMAEVIFNKILAANKVSNQYFIDSAGLIAYHEGELADSRMRFHASKRNYAITHRSRPFRNDDFDNFDLIIGMDNENITLLRKRARNEAEVAKILKMTQFCEKLDAIGIPDPYYGGDYGFENVIDLLEDACDGLFKKLNKNTI